MAALRRRDGRGQAGRAAADDRDPLAGGGGAEHEQRLVRGAGVDQAAGGAALEGVVQAGLVARDARVDLLRLVGLRLARPVRVGEPGPGHLHQVGLAVSERPLGLVGHVDPVRGDHRDPDVRSQPAGDLGEGAPGHRGDDGRHPGLVPADAGGDDRRAGRLDLGAQGEDLLPGLAVLDEVEHREPVDDDEVLAHRGPHRPHDLGRQPAPVRRGAAPAVAPLVGSWGQELVDEVALGTHHLDPVVARAPGQLGRPGEAAHLPAHPPLGQGPRAKGGDRRLQRRRRDRPRVVGVAPRVQDLQGDLAALGVHRLGDLLVPAGLAAGGQLGGEGVEGALDVRREAAGDDEAGATLRPLRVEGGQPLEAAGPVLQAGVHRAHDRAVRQRGEAEIERLEEPGIGGHAGLRPGRALRGHCRFCLTATWPPVGRRSRLTPRLV